MLEQLNISLQEYKALVRSKDKLVAEIEDLTQSLASERAKLTDLAKELKREGKDVERLEGISLVALFYTILGSKDEQLEKERQEYLAVQLRYDGARVAVTTLEEKLETARQRNMGLGDVEARYQQLLEEKERYLVASNHQQAPRLVELSEAMVEAELRIKEIKEALQASNGLQQAIQDLRSTLESAKGWGTWDIIGGGLLTTAVKHARINDARNQVYEVQQQLRDFIRELKDVEQRADTELTIDIGNLLTFADYFFDGLITDWVVLSRINNSLEQTLTLANKISTTVAWLKQDLATQEATLKSLQAERQKMLEL